MKLTKVIINSITIKDSNGSPDPSKLISWEYEKDDEAISEAEIIVPRNINDLVDVNNGQTVEIWSGWTTSTDKRYFYGYIDNIKPDGATIKITCKNEMIKLVRKSVNHVYDSSVDTSAGEVSEIVEDLIDCGKFPIGEGWTDEQIEEKANKIVDGYDWEKCISIRINVRD